MQACGQLAMRVLNRVDHVPIESNGLPTPHYTVAAFLETVGCPLEETVQLLAAVHADDSPHPMVMG